MIVRKQYKSEEITQLFKVDESDLSTGITWLKSPPGVHRCVTSAAMRFRAAELERVQRGERVECNDVIIVEADSYEEARDECLRLDAEQLTQGVQTVPQ